VFSGDGQGQIHADSLDSEMEPHVPVLSVADVPGRYVRVFSRAEGDPAAADRFGEAPDPPVVEIDDGDAVLRQEAEEVSLFFGDGFQRAETLEVSGAHVGDDADVRPGDPGERGDFSRPVRAEFDDGRLVFFPQPQQRQRKPHEVIEVSLGLQNALRLRENGGGHFLGRRLPGASRDGEHGQRKSAAPGAGDPSERRQRILHPDGRGRSEFPNRFGGEVPVHDDARCAGADGGAQESVSVEPLASQRHEEVPFAETARIRRDPREDPVAFARDRNAVRSLQDLSHRQRRQGRHRSRPPESARRASA